PGPYALYGCGAAPVSAPRLALALTAAGRPAPRRVLVHAAPTADAPDRDHLRRLAAAVALPVGFLEEALAADGPEPADPAHPWHPILVLNTPSPARGAGAGDGAAGRDATGHPVDHRPSPAVSSDREDRARRLGREVRAALLGEGGAAPVPTPGGAGMTAAGFREAMAHLASPVAVVTALDDRGTPRSFTAGSLCSLSEDPPLVLVCLNRRSAVHEVFTTTERFVINVLTERQAGLARAFARHDRAGAEAGLLLTGDGPPVLPEAAARFHCRLRQVLPGGDHRILVGLLEHAEVTPAAPLVHHRRGFHRPVAVPESPAASPDPAVVREVLAR
ncbi:flavin reductase family protein, partial [Streptomyces calidiresistens]